jgi:hypothetical protein
MYAPETFGRVQSESRAGQVRNRSYSFAQQKSMPDAATSREAFLTSHRGLARDKEGGHFPKPY